MAGKIGDKPAAGSLLTRVTGREQARGQAVGLGNVAVEVAALGGGLVAVVALVARQAGVDPPERAGKANSY